jgi:HPt (histidine-containing phosphotransfer) domain-containing protein
MTNEQSKQPPAAETDIEASKKSKSFYSSPRYLAIVERFKQQLPEMVKELSEAVRTEDWERVKDKSHELKGISHELKGIGGAMGFPQITEIARQMYTHASDENYDHVTLTCAELEKECQSLVQSFKQVDG